MRFIRSALALAIVALAASAAVAQTGGLKVVVTDADGAPLPGATVTISHETGFIKTTAVLTDKNGVAEFPVLRPGGGYTVRVSFPGYADRQEEGIRVKISNVSTIAVQMIEEFQERVKVTAKEDVIDLETTEQTTKFSDSFIADLPVPGRHYQSVLTMAPGVEDADGDGNPNVHGSRTRDFKAIVGNVANVDPLTGQYMSEINPNSIEEMEVITAGAGVEFGWAQGGFANIIQKQGSNTHEGTFDFYWRTSILDGDGAGHYNDTTTPNYDQTTPSVQFSGPIVKDKLWYRVSWEKASLENPVNTTDGIVIQTTDQDTRDAQVTWQVSPRNKLALQYRSDPQDLTGVGVSSRVPLDSSLAYHRESQTWSMTWTAPYSPKVLVESTAAYQDLNTGRLPTRAGQPNDCFHGAGPTDFLNGAQCYDFSSDTTSGSYFRIDDDHRQRLTVSGKATVYGGRFWGMSHQFKMGVSVENERYFRSLTRNPNIFYFVVNSPDDDPSNPEQTPASYAYAFTTVAVPSTDDVRATGTNWSFYAEDQFKPRQNLTITLGARVDREEINSEGRQPFSSVDEFSNYLDLASLALQDNDHNNRPDFETQPNLNQEAINAEFSSFIGYEDLDAYANQLKGLLCAGADPDVVQNCQILVDQRMVRQTYDSLYNLRRDQDINIDNTNFSPYLSVAWSPWSNQKTAFKATVGRHYNNVQLLLPLQELNPVQTTLLYKVDLKTGLPAAQGSFSPTVNVQAVDRNLRTPYQDEFTFSVERELWAETSVHFTYIKRKYRDQIQDKNLNVNTGDFGRCLLGKVQPSYGMYPDVPEYRDEYTGELVRDVDPGYGDGHIDDCVGDLQQLSFASGDDQGGGNQPGLPTVNFLEVPDGIPDLYVQNPFWGDIYVIGNYNSADYTAYVLELVRNQYRSWEFNGSYTWSKAVGDGEDFFQTIGDDPSLEDNVRGYQSYDRRHHVKLAATTITPWGIRLGTSVSWQSGLPYSIIYQEPSSDNVPWVVPKAGSTGFRVRQRYPTGVRNDQRNESYWNVDVKATKEFNLGRGLNMQLSAEIFNLLDDGTYIVWNQGTEIGTQINGTNDAYRRFGRYWQLGMKLSF